MKPIPEAGHYRAGNRVRHGVAPSGARPHRPYAPHPAQPRSAGSTSDDLLESVIGCGVLLLIVWGLLALIF